jgi:Protein of unknown function (DUF1579)
MTKFRVILSTSLTAAFAIAATAAAADKAPPPSGPPSGMMAAPKPAQPNTGVKVVAPTAMGGAASAPAAPAAPAAAPPMPAPSKDLEAFMKGFEGSWKCETKFAAGSMGPGSPEMTTKTTVKFKKEFGGFSWHGEYSLAKTKTMPAMSGVLQISYDPGSNHAVLVGYDSMGGSFFGSGPIAGDTLVVNEDGYMMGSKMKLRETMIKKGPKEVYHKFETDMGKGFQVMGEDSCKK